jgi:DNA (cytosine-5)-methyltransferase 1
MTTLRALCSGYGGLELAIEAVTGAITIDHAEVDARAIKVHDAHWPGMANLGDITTLDWAGLEPTDIICAGFPCQPISKAGHRKVTADARWIWPHIADGVRVLRPRLVILENVPQLLRLWRDDDGWWNPAPVEEVAGDLAALGYVGSWRCLRASDAGAPHQRERVFIVAADTHGPGLEGHGELHVEGPQGAAAAHDRRVDPGDRPAFGDWGRFEPAIRWWERLTRPAPWPTDDNGELNPVLVEWMMGLPEGWVTGVDISRTAQLKILGNGVVPQQAVAALADQIPLMEEP